MEVNVGQVLYVLNSKSHSLLPAQVDEIVVSKTLRGETTQHILALQNGRKVALEDLKTPWFKELDAAKAFLLSEAEKMIDQVQCLPGRLMPEDVARLVLFLASDDSAMCTAQDFIVDAGWVLSLIHI